MSAWRKSTVWRRTMKGYPAGWVTIEHSHDEPRTYRWEVVLVDVVEPSYGQCVRSFATAVRAAMAEYEVMGERLERARGGS